MKTKTRPSSNPNRAMVGTTSNSFFYRHGIDGLTPGSAVLSHIISQLRPGADLSRVTLPTFILEPRSMLERITKYVCGCFGRSANCARTDSDSCSFMAHPETLLPMTTIDDPLERFKSVVKFYLSGWHIKPPCDFPRFLSAVVKS